MRITNPGAVIEDTLRDEILASVFKSCGHLGLLLDLGCGTRPYFNLYSSCFDKTIGADLPDSPFPKDKIDIYCTATSIPLESDSVDAVISTEVLHDLPEPREMLREVHRILKPGGIIILTTPFVVPTVDGEYDHYRYTQQGLRYLLNAENYDVKEIIPVSDVIGATITLYIKPLLRIWNSLAKLLKVKGIYSIYNPFFFLTVILPQAVYLWGRRIKIIKKFYNKFCYGAIGFVSIGVKKT